MNSLGSKNDPRLWSKINDTSVIEQTIYYEILSIFKHFTQMKVNLILLRVTLVVVVSYM